MDLKRHFMVTTRVPGSSSRTWGLMKSDFLLQMVPFKIGESRKVSGVLNDHQIVKCYGCTHSLSLEKGKFRTNRRFYITG